MVVVHSSLPQDASADTLSRAGAFAYLPKVGGGTDLAAQLVELYAEYLTRCRPG